MGKFDELLKAEIARLAKKATKDKLLSQSKEIRKLKSDVSALNKTVAALEKKIAKLERQQPEPKLKATKSEVNGARFSPGLIKKLRKRLGISQRELGLLISVSTNAVITWESGRSNPRDESKAAMIALRKLGRREVLNLIAEKSK